MDYMSLQNVSDVRGFAMPDGKHVVNLTEQAVSDIAAAFVLRLAVGLSRKPGQLTIGVGHDSRLTAESLTKAAVRGITAVGAKAVYCGLASTPAMFMSCLFPKCRFDASMELTASHLPKERNGIKFFTPEGGLDKEDITEILKAASTRSNRVETQLDAGTNTECPLMNYYTAFLRQKITEEAGKGDKPLAGLHIVVDAGNGVGGFFATDVLAPLGADISGSRYLDPDGSFPHHIPNPENRDAMDSLREAVLESHADLGFIFDTDVDRMSVVFPDGREVSRDAVIALAAAVLAPENPGCTIVTDSVTSDRLTDFLENILGLHHLPFKRGYRNVISKARELNKEGVPCPLAMERRIPIVSGDVAGTGTAALKAFEENAHNSNLAVVPTYEGVRVKFPAGGWIMLRQSLHEPLLPLNLEGEREGEEQELLSVSRTLLTGIPGLDLSVIV